MKKTYSIPEMQTVFVSPSTLMTLSTNESTEAVIEDGKVTLEGRSRNDFDDSDNSNGWTDGLW